MAKARTLGLIDRALHACLAAIEIYNKPDFRYREETFSILMINAWELLLKARMLKENRNNPKSIQVWESWKKKDGAKSRRKRPRRNRSGNIMTIGIMQEAEVVRQLAQNNIDQRCVDNIALLMEIRDNSVHFHNHSPGLSKRIQEVGSASLRNFARSITTWFNVDLSRFNFYLMPIAFHDPAEMVESLVHGHHPGAVRKLLNFIAEKEREHPSDEAMNFNVTLQVELRFTRTTDPHAAPVQIARGPDAVKVEMNEEDFRRNYPWDFKRLTDELRKRYPNFRQDKRFNDIKKRLENDPRLCHVRRLDPTKPNGTRKRFYSSNIIGGFDRHYNQA